MPPSWVFCPPLFPAALEAVIRFRPSIITIFDCSGANGAVSAGKREGGGGGSRGRPPGRQGRATRPAGDGSPGSAAAPRSPGPSPRYCAVAEAAAPRSRRNPARTIGEPSCRTSQRTSRARANKRVPARPGSTSDADRSVRLVELRAQGLQLAGVVDADHACRSRSWTSSGPRIRPAPWSTPAPAPAPARR